MASRAEFDGREIRPLRRTNAPAPTGPPGSPRYIPDHIEGYPPYHHPDDDITLYSDQELVLYQIFKSRREDHQTIRDNLPKAIRDILLPATGNHAGLPEGARQPYMQLLADIVHGNSCHSPLCQTYSEPPLDAFRALVEHYSMLWEDHDNDPANQVNDHGLIIYAPGSDWSGTAGRYLREMRPNQEHLLHPMVGVDYEVYPIDYINRNIHLALGAEDNGHIRPSVAIVWARAELRDPLLACALTSANCVVAVWMQWMEFRAPFNPVLSDLLRPYWEHSHVVIRQDTTEGCWLIICKSWQALRDWCPADAPDGVLREQPHVVPASHAELAGMTYRFEKRCAELGMWWRIRLQDVVGTLTAWNHKDCGIAAGPRRR